jgi:hypothetical protein
MEGFSGWEEEGAAAGENILKQLKHNLNSYERSFNDLARQAHQPKRRSHSLLGHSTDKENQTKLPVLHPRHPSYCAFLDSHFSRRGGQGDGEKRGPRVVVMEGRREGRCESFVQFCRKKD